MTVQADIGRLSELERLYQEKPILLNMFVLTTLLFERGRSVFFYLYGYCSYSYKYKN